MSAQERNCKGAGNTVAAWPSTLGWWTPVMTGCAAANTRAHQTCIDLSLEWQTFVCRRLNRDFHLLQELIAAKDPDQVWKNWLRFWQNAAEDYGTEYSVMAKLAAGFVPNMTSIRLGDSGAATLIARPQSKAA